MFFSDCSALKVRRRTFCSGCVKPAEEFVSRRERKFCNCSSGAVKNQLKAIKLRTRKIEKEKVAVVNFEINESSRDSMSGSVVERVSDSMKITNEQEARFRFR